jgi:hypothetical protein
MSVPIERNERVPVDQSVLCSWAPIYVDPLPGSGQRLTIGVVAANREAYHLGRANRLDRLKQLRGDTTAAMVSAVVSSLDAFEALLAKRGFEALKDPHWLIDCISLGVIQQVSGPSVRDVALLWLSFTSSLHQPNVLDDDTTALIVASET